MTTSGSLKHQLKYFLVVAISHHMLTTKLYRCTQNRKNDLRDPVSLTTLS